MKNRVMRIALVVLALAAQAAAGFFVYRSEQALASARAEAAALAGDAARAQAAHRRPPRLADRPGGERPGPVVLGAEGRGPREGRDGGDREDRPRPAHRRRRAGPGGRRRRRWRTSRGTSDRVRDLLATDQPLTASSLAFGDAARHLATAAGALTGVVSSQAAAVEREATRLRPREGLALAGAAAITLVALLLLLPRASQETTPAEAEGQAASLALPLTMSSAADLNGLGRSGFDLDIRRPAAPPPTEPLPEQPRESEEAIVDDLKRETALRLNTEAQVDLAAAARLCSDLSRVKDAGQLPALLARAAELLDASGIVLWLAGPEGTVIRPAASVGYSDHTLSRMKALSGRSDNAVSVAFREGRMEVVAGTKERNGAVVVPIVTVGGRAGALAAEIRHGAESSPSVQAVVTIVAAQLASLVADTAT